MTFKELNITEPILKAIEEKGYTVPTPIQEKAIPVALAKKDILGCAQTGTGKTASFAIPIIQHLHLNKGEGKRSGIKALILTPTRELALQISECIEDYSKYTRDCRRWNFDRGRYCALYGTGSFGSADGKYFRDNP